ncbi:MAG: hypothetical protein IJA33_02650 [Oscillospiraceae bacterium]|nr:hypothetical protein [Oscillospiraceae bacterium]
MAAPLQYKVGCYSRLSREDGDKPESDSIINQQRFMEDFCAGRGDLAIVKHYSDATDIIGLKQNPTNGRRFSPIFSFIGHFRYKTRKCYF